MRASVLHLVFNPAAGRGRAARALEPVLRFFAERDVPIRQITTTGPGDATRAVRALPEDARVVALGGDGTVHECARACAGTPRALGILPLGSGDDFAFALGMDRRDLAGALGRVLAGRTREVDTGVANGERFVNAVGVGFDADAAERMRRAPRFLKGRAAYGWAVLATLAALRGIDARIEVDGVEAHRGPCLLVSTQNGPRTGGSFLFAPGARPDDGKLDVVIAGRFGRLATLGVLPRVLRGAHEGHPQVKRVAGTRVRLEWSEPRPVHLDGEAGERSRVFELRLEPRSLRVFG